MSALKLNDEDFETKSLHVPPLEEVKEVLQAKLPDNFEEVKVEVVDCPNLTHAPFMLANSGLGGNPTLIEIGGPPYLLPTVDRSKLYDVKQILRRLFSEKDDILTVGAGAGPYTLRETNCEGIFNLNVNSDGTVKNLTNIARVEPPNEKCCLENVPNWETKCALLLNLYACQGKSGKVLRVYCKKRVGQKDYAASIRTALEEHFQEKCVGLGGVFLIRNGNVKQHVMRDFSSTPIQTEEELNNWLKFYDMPAPLNAVGTLVTNENGLDLRLQHFHSFSKTEWGGHYHIDTTPNTIEYDGYFNIGERIVRVDRPKMTHKFGRD